MGQYLLKVLAFLSLKFFSNLVIKFSDIIIYIKGINSKIKIEWRGVNENKSKNYVSFSINDYNDCK